MSIAIEGITPDVFGRLLGSAEIGLRYMQAMVDAAVFPDGATRSQVISDIEVVTDAIYHAQYPTATEKIDAHIKELIEERGEDDPVVIALRDVLEEVDKDGKTKIAVSQS